VDVSIIGQTATFHSFTDPPVSLPLYGLAAAAQMLFTLRVYISVDVISIIDKTATLLSFMDLLVLSIVRSTS
jgi:hypothetical protein